MARSFRRVRDAYDTGPGYGHCSIASNGMWCASWPEREMCEWLIERGIEFEMHKPLPTAECATSTSTGVYWEMDGMDRSPEYFAEKYGDLPYVVVTPEDFRFRVERHLATAHVENGDPSSRSSPSGAVMTYDVEMAADGPLNFLANGIVSHNSHAACYALISYRTAWLKANYPAEYMAALISSVMDTKDKVPFFVDQARGRWGSRSCRRTSTSPTTSSWSSRATSASGWTPSRASATRRSRRSRRAREEGGPFTSLWDFCERVDAARSTSARSRR